jgi:beta-glucosidase
MTPVESDLVKRFGPARVDYATQCRTIKSTGRRFAELIAAARAAS